MENQPVVLITGCSSGIGFETAVQLARNGWRVFATVRNPAKAGPLREAGKGLSLETLALDVDKPSSVQKAVAAVLRKAGRIDALVNNAGWGAFGALEEFTDKEILGQYETNLFGLLRLTRAVLPVMRKQGSGRILHVGSLAGKMTFAGIGLYCSTKHAVEAVTESLRLEVRPFNIQVGVVEPGTIRTRFKANRRIAPVLAAGKSAYQGPLEKVLNFANNPLSSAPGPDKVASAILKALRAPRMALRYPVGNDAVFLPRLRWFMPDSLYDFVLRKRYDRFRQGAA